MPDLLEIENIASDTPGRTVTLSGISVTVLFSVLNAGFKITDWWVGDLPLDQSQKDQVYAWLALANKELMVSQIGEIKATAAGAIPPGCLFCDGAIYEKDDYPDLYAAIAPAFILSSTQFFVPDLRGIFPSGALALSNVGETGGAASITLSTSQIPSHSHTIPATITTLAVEPGEISVLSPVPIISSNTGDTGGDGSHDNIPPFLALAYYIVAA